MNVVPVDVGMVGSGTNPAGGNGKAWILRDQGCGIDANARNITIEPEAQDAEEFLCDIRVRPIEVGLGGVE